MSDKARALSKIRRVIEPEERLVLIVWSEISPVFMVLAEALEHHIGAAIAERTLAPLAFKNLSPYRVDDGFFIPQTTFILETSANAILMKSCNKHMGPCRVPARRGFTADSERREVHR